MLTLVFLENVNKFNTSGSVFIIKFLDKVILNTILESYISYNSSFVRKISDDKIKYIMIGVIIFRLKKKYIPKRDIETIFNKFGWKLTFYCSESDIDRYDTDWHKYFKCFSVIFVRN